MEELVKLVYILCLTRPLNICCRGDVKQIMPLSSIRTFSAWKYRLFFNKSLHCTSNLQLACIGHLKL